MGDVGQTDGKCRDCGENRTFSASTLDNVHGMDSHILAEMAAELGIDEVTDDED